MRFTADSKNISSALAFVGKAVKNASTLPFTSYVRIEAGEKVKAAATNVELYLEHDIQTEEVSEEGTAVVPFSVLRNIIKDISGTVELSKEDGTLNLRYGTGGSVKIKCLDDTDFPAEMWENSINSGSFCRIDEQFLTALASVAFAAAKESQKNQTRYIFEAVAVDCRNGSAAVVATDARRLAVCENVGKLDYEGLFLLPAYNVSEIVKLAPNEVSFGDTVVVFRGENGTIAVRQIEGSYPDYRSVLPERTDPVLKIKKDEIEPVIRRACSLANGIKHPCLAITVGKDGVTLSIKSEDGQMVEKVNTETAVKEEITVHLNPTFFYEMIANFPVSDEDEMEFEIYEELKPVICRKNGYTSLLLPLKV